jgi:hypothetical protein
MLSFWSTRRSCEYSPSDRRIRFADSGLRTQAMNLEGVLVGAVSEVGVTVPESGQGGEGIYEFSLSEENIPDKMAVPSVPSYTVSQTLENREQRTKSEEEFG